MKVITAIDEVYSMENHSSIKVFLAGGITNCPDWQQEAITEFQNNSYILYHDMSLTLYNPRRKNFPIHDPNASEQQITWEYEHLDKADGIIFWFAKGSLNPIVLYELGRWGNSSNKIISIGCDPNYERISDVVIQTKLSRPDVKVFDNLYDVVKDLLWKIKARYSNTSYEK